METDDFSRAKFGLRDELSRHCTLVVWVWGFVILWPISFGWHPPSPHSLTNMTLHCQTDDAFFPLPFFPFSLPFFFFKRQPDRPIWQRQEWILTDWCLCYDFQSTLSACADIITASSPWPSHGWIGSGRVGSKASYTVSRVKKPNFFWPIDVLGFLFVCKNNPQFLRIYPWFYSSCCHMYSSRQLSTYHGFFICMTLSALTTG